MNDETDNILYYEGEVNPYKDSDFLEQSRERITQQFKDKDVLDRYLQVMTVGKTELESVIKDLMQKRTIDNSSGAQLEVIGDIVGQPRTLFDSGIIQYFGFNGATGASPYKSVADTDRVYGPWKGTTDPLFGTRVLSDEEYRRLIKIKILKNSSSASMNSFLSGVQVLFGLDQVSYDAVFPTSLDEGDGIVTINIGRDFNDPELTVFPGLDEIELANRYLNRPLGVSIAYQEPVSFTADFIQQRYSEFDAISGGTVQVSFDQMFDFYRGYEDTYYDFNGNLQTAAINEPRFGYDPNTLEPYGLLLDRPEEYLEHVWDFEVDDQFGTFSVNFANVNETQEAQLAFLVQGTDFKLMLYWEYGYWKVRVETPSETTNRMITQTRSQDIQVTVSYNTDVVYFKIGNEDRLVEITTNLGDTNLQGTTLRIGGSYTTTDGILLDQFTGSVKTFTYLRAPLRAGDAIFAGDFISTESYDKLLTEAGDYIIY